MPSDTVCLGGIDSDEPNPSQEIHTSCGGLQMFKINAPTNPAEVI